MNIPYSENAKKVLDIAQQKATMLKHAVISTEHVLLAISTMEECSAYQTLKKYKVTESRVENIINEFYSGYGETVVTEEYCIFSPRLKKVLQCAQRLALVLKQDTITTNILLMALIKEKELTSRLILSDNCGIDIKELLKVLRYTISKANSVNSKKHSSTPALAKVSVDLTRQALRGMIDPLIGRTKELKRVIQVISRRVKNSPMLVGDPGVGKTSIAQGLALAIVNKEVPVNLLNKRILSLDLASLVAGTKYRGDFETKMKTIINEVRRDGSIILFIDEIHTLVGAGGAEGAINASNILKPFLSRGEIQVIGATTFDEYQKYLEKDPALARRFQRIKVGEPTAKETLGILQGLKSKYEEFHNVNIEADALKEAVDLSVRYISNRFLPDKAIDVMDEACSAVKIKHNATEKDSSGELKVQIADLAEQKQNAVIAQDIAKAGQLYRQELQLKAKLQKMLQQKDTSKPKRPLVTVDQVEKVVSELTGVPVTKMQRQESKRLAKLESILHQRVIGQNLAVEAVSRAIRRSRSGIKDLNRPIGSFLFLGPTGVGKTELAKALADAVFGSEKNIIRVDMSEYMDKVAVTKLIGSAPGYVGYEAGGQLAEKVRRNPYSVILLDEVEKAHPDIFNILLQVLDEGFLTDSKGRKIDFRNTIIIMTSNLGSRSLKDDKTVGFATSNQDINGVIKEKVSAATKNFFRPEFLNRIDEQVVFESLDKKQIRQIVVLMINQLVQRLQEKKIAMKITTGAMDILAKDGFDPEMGARPLRRAIQHEVEDVVAKYLISGELHEHQILKLSAKNGKLTFAISDNK